MSSENKDFPEILPVISLGQVTIFPLALAPLAVSDETSIKVIVDAMREDRTIAIFAKKTQDAKKLEPQDLYPTGSAAQIQQMLRVPDGTLRMVVQGLARVRVKEWISTEPYLKARVEVAEEVMPQGLEVEAMIRTVKDLVIRLARLTPEMPDEIGQLAESIKDPFQLIYFSASLVSLRPEVRQEILEDDDPISKLKRVIDILQHEVEVKDISQRIREETKEKLAKAQKEYFLREQMRAIRKELGEEDGIQAEVRQIKEKMEKVSLSEEAKREVERELSRLERISESSPEYNVIRTWLDWILGLPWGVKTGYHPEISEAKKILDEDHFDLEKVKERILEYLAVRKIRAMRETEQHETREPILCFVGPPGVGKTSLGQSIARATGRKFARISLGGVHDEAEIRGHRRTYIGAMPGRIIQSIRKAEALDPVFMLDEVDKLGRGIHGDPSSALLEVLDPAQNHTFVDNYLGVAFDLSQVMFICTANTTDTIPPPVLDRMEVIYLPGYTEEEKVFIAKHFVIPRQKKANGLTDNEAIFSEEGIKAIIRGYTREAGVRSLEREVAQCLRKIAMKITQGQQWDGTVGEAEVQEFLGPKRYEFETKEYFDRPGVAAGLAWTPTGGEILFVEAVVTPNGNGKITLTGHLGDVMKESAYAALTCVKSRVKDFSLANKDLHIHVPAGAVPKDGPSAGVTIVVALASSIMGRKVYSDIAMTGEVTLRGKVLPVGGIREKVLAAHRAGIRTVILPKRNDKDLVELPKPLKDEMKFILVDSVDEVLEHALVKTQDGD